MDLHGMLVPLASECLGLMIVAMPMPVGIAEDVSYVSPDLAHSEQASNNNL